MTNEDGAARLAHLLEALRRAPEFESCSRVLLDAVLARASETAGADPDAHLLRAGLFLATGRGFRGAHVVEVGGPDDPPLSLPSHTALKMAARLGEPVFINIGLEQVGPAWWDSEHPTEAEPDVEPVLLPDATLQVLAERMATHIYAIPLRRGDRVEGLVTLEWQVPGMVNRPLASWFHHGRQVQLLVDIGAPFVLSRPFASLPAQAHSGLPVVGTAMVPVLATLRQFAMGNASILLSGPTGAGKSTLAEWVHKNSGRGKGPFRTLHLQNYPSDVASAYLFGWERGAFTGAVDSYPGELAQAEGGTLFLDEIGLLSPETQGQLLQFLLTRHFRRRGQRGSDQRADVRIVSATNVDLLEAVEAGRFRRDVYARLAERPVEIPGLDERRDEIAAWAHVLLTELHQRETRRRDVEISAEAISILTAQSWPASLHTLRNIVGTARDLAVLEGVDGPVQVDAHHVLQALRPSRRQATVAARLQAAARAWMDELDAAPAERRAHRAWRAAKGLFRSYVLLEAVRRHSLRDAFVRLGEPNRLAHNNHSRELSAAKELVDGFEKTTP